MKSFDPKTYRNEANFVIFLPISRPLEFYELCTAVYVKTSGNPMTTVTKELQKGQSTRKLFNYSSITLPRVNVNCKKCKAPHFARLTWNKRIFCVVQFSKERCLVLRLTIFQILIWVLHFLVPRSQYLTQTHIECGKVVSFQKTKRVENIKSYGDCIFQSLGRKGILVYLLLLLGFSTYHRGAIK